MEQKVETGRSRGRGPSGIFMSNSGDITPQCWALTTRPGRYGLQTVSFGGVSVLVIQQGGASKPGVAAGRSSLPSYHDIRQNNRLFQGSVNSAYNPTDVRSYANEDVTSPASSFKLTEETRIDISSLSSRC